MLKSELIAALAERHGVAQQKAESAVNRILDEIAGALARGDRVELRGFGAFSVRERPARRGRNPRTGEPVDVASKRVPFFRAGKELRQRVDAGGAGDRDDDSEQAAA